VGKKKKMVIEYVLYVLEKSKLQNFVQTVLNEKLIKTVKQMITG
jgi:hypothetical protein